MKTAKLWPVRKKNKQTVNKQRCAAALVWNVLVCSFISSRLLIINVIEPTKAELTPFTLQKLRCRQRRLPVLVVKTSAWPLLNQKTIIPSGSPLDVVYGKDLRIKMQIHQPCCQLNTHQTAVALPFVLWINDLKWKTSTAEWSDCVPVTPGRLRGGDGCWLWPSRLCLTGLLAISH